MTETNTQLVEKARGNVSQWINHLGRYEFLPSFYMITVGMPYRRETEFFKAAGKRDLYRGSPGFEEFRNEFFGSYDMYSGDNLAAVAAYQAKRENKANFPNDDTEEYKALVKIMGRFGMRLKELIKLEGPEIVNKLALQHFSKQHGISGQQ